MPMPSPGSCCFFVSLHLKEGSIWHGLGLLLLKGPKPYSSYRYWKSFIFKVFSGRAFRSSASMTTSSLNQNSICCIFFSRIKSLFSLRDFTSKCPHTARRAGHGKELLPMFFRRKKYFNAKRKVLYLS